MERNKDQGANLYIFSLKRSQNITNSQGPNCHKALLSSEPINSKTSCWRALWFTTLSLVSVLEVHIHIHSAHFHCLYIFIATFPGVLSGDSLAQIII